MNSIDFAELSPADATRWLEHVELRGTARLVELADFVHDDHGPIEQADASWDSLSTLWEWAVDFVRRGGTTSLRGEVRQASRVAAFGLEEVPSAFGAVAEDLGHYVFEVLRRIEPTIRWALYLSPATARVKDGHHQETGIRFGTSWWNVESDLPRFLRRASQGEAAMADPGALQRLALHRLELLAAPSTAPAPSILTPLVGTSTPKVPTPTFRLNPARRTEATHGYPLHTFRAPGSSAIARQDDAGVPTEVVVAFLRQFGFEFDDSYGDAALKDGSAGFLGWLYSRGIGVEIDGYGGRVTSIYFDPLVVTPEEWNQFFDAAQQFARTHRGTFHADGS